MTLPAGIQTIPVRYGRRFNLLGTTASLTGTFELDQDLLWSATGDILERYATPATYNPTTGMLEFDFPTSDQGGFEVPGTGMEVTDFKGILRASVGSRQLPPIVFQVTEVDFPGPVDLDFFVPAQLRPGATAQTPYVRSIGPLSGPVSLGDLADALSPFLPSPEPLDTGWRFVSGLGPPVPSFYIRRQGSLVYLTTGEVVSATETGSQTALDTIPVGFQPPLAPASYYSFRNFTVSFIGAGSDNHGRITIAPNPPAELEEQFIPLCSWFTDQPFPSSLPGSAVPS